MSLTTQERLLAHPQALCQQVRRAVLTAGEATLPFYHQAGTLTFEIKEDGSPVGEADRIAETIIESALHEITPSIPVIGEEAVSCGRIPEIASSRYFWLVDPVDGTKGFTSGEYTVNVALIRDGQPFLGVVFAPVAGDLYSAWEGGPAIRHRPESGSEKKITVRDIPRQGFTIVTNRSSDRSGRISKFSERFKVEKTLRLSSSLKLCLIASGKADLYPRFGRIHEWDIAAAHAILNAAGGVIMTLSGEPLTYGHPDRHFVSPEFVASAGLIPREELLAEE